MIWVKNVYYWCEDDCRYGKVYVFVCKFQIKYQMWMNDGIKIYAVLINHSDESLHYNNIVFVLLKPIKCNIKCQHENVAKL